MELNEITKRIFYFTLVLIVAMLLFAVGQNQDAIKNLQAQNETLSEQVNELEGIREDYNKFKEEMVIMKSLIQDVNQIRDVYYYEDIDLPQDLQYHAYLTAKRYDVNYKDVLAIMYVESRFDEDAINTSNRNETVDYGLMQVNTVHIEDSNISVEEILCPYKNIEVGIKILADKQSRVGDGVSLYLAYNRGVSGSRGIESNAYSNKVLEYKNSL